MGYARALLVSALQLLIVCSVIAQNQTQADSVISILKSNQLQGNTKLELLRQITILSTEPTIRLKYSLKLVDEALSVNDNYYLQSGYLTMGTAKLQMGKIEESLDALFKGAKVAEKNGMNLELGAFYGQISIVYGQSGDKVNAMKFKKKALNIFEKEDDHIYVGYGCVNIGYEYYRMAEYDSALTYYRRAEVIFDSTNQQLPLAYVIGNRALVYWKQDKIDLAEAGLLDAIARLKPLEDNYAVADYLNQLGRVYFENGEFEKSLVSTQESLTIGKRTGLKDQMRDACLLLSKVYAAQSEFAKAYGFHKQYVAYKDSIQDKETTQRMADLRTEFEVGQKQAEVDLLTVEKRNQQLILIATAAFALLFIVLAGIIYRYYRTKSRINQILATQKSELEALNQTKDKFFSIISHDLRGPVSSFHGVTRLMKTLVESNDKESLLMFADEMDKSVSQLSSLLDNLLTWAMQQQGNFTLSPERLSLPDVIGDMVGSLSNMAKGKRIELKTQIQNDLTVWVDKNTTTTILRNITNNALKFTPEGGKVVIEARKLNDQAEIRVTDSGVGIPKDKLDTLFNFQAKKSTFGTQGEKGLGLGLQLVHEFLALNGGTITVESIEGQGTTFVLLLPLSSEPESVSV